MFGNTFRHSTVEVTDVDSRSCDEHFSEKFKYIRNWLLTTTHDLKKVFIIFGDVAFVVKKNSG